MSEWFREIAIGAGLDEHVAWKADVCLNEAATNIILHGFDDAVRPPITIELQPGRRAMTMTIVDEGRPFNPLDAAPPRFGRSLEDTPVGGLGIHLLRAYAADIRYTREESRNILVMTFEADLANNGPG